MRVNMRSRRRPTFAPCGTIIGAGELDFRVRDGNGYRLPAVAAGACLSCVCPRPRAPMPGAGRGNGNMVKPHGLLVPLGCACRHACTCGLSTRCSPGGLQGDLRPLGSLILGRASRLDAFSGYPSRT